MVAKLYSALLQCLQCACTMQLDQPVSEQEGERAEKRRVSLGWRNAMIAEALCWAWLVDLSSRWEAQTINSHRDLLDSTCLGIRMPVLNLNNFTTVC